MTAEACRLNHDERAAVEEQIRATCSVRRWHLHAVNCRSNHVHVVVTAPEIKPKKVRADLKAWATRCLKEQFDPAREDWWAERGSIRHLFNDAALESAILYVLDGQDRKLSPVRCIQAARSAGMSLQPEASERPKGDDMTQPLADPSGYDGGR